MPLTSSSNFSNSLSFLTFFFPWSLILQLVFIMARKKQVQKRAKSKVIISQKGWQFSSLQVPFFFFFFCHSGSPVDSLVQRNLCTQGTKLTHRPILSPKAVRLTVQMASGFGPKVPFVNLKLSTVCMLKFITPKYVTKTLSHCLNRNEELLEPEG